MTRHANRSFRPGLPFICLAVLLCVLLLAGGSSRGDVFGQVLVRGTAWVLVVVSVLFGPRPQVSAAARPVLLLLLAVSAIIVMQLTPLPPALWQALPGRDFAVEAARLGGGDQLWRPLSLVPGATINAAFSLVVPFATLLFMAGMNDRERRWTLGLLVLLVALAMLAGLVQLGGIFLKNPLIGDTDVQVSGIFSNRNHFALLLVLGCLLAPAWAFANRNRPYLRGLTALGLVLLFGLTILAVGSRAGLGLCLPALAIGTWLARRQMRRALGDVPRWIVFAAVGAGVALIALVTAASVTANRAAAIDRVFSVDQGQDMRTRGLPVVLDMIREYFPAGSGFGGFDPVFRLHEPFALLKPTFFNHAHSDYLELVLDGGVPGLLLIVCALGWWAWASFDAWRPQRKPAQSSSERLLPRLGSAVLLFTLAASLFDYPARTPTFMVVAIVAAMWLGDRRRTDGDVSLTRK